jgi:general L-amino acid transport system substrate-binding protein
LTARPLIADSVPQARDDFFAGRCRAYTSDSSTLASIRFEGSGGADRFRILSERISKEPFGPVVNRGDEQWATLVKVIIMGANNCNRPMEGGKYI